MHQKMLTTVAYLFRQATKTQIANSIIIKSLVQYTMKTAIVCLLLSGTLGFQVQQKPASLVRLRSTTGKDSSEIALPSINFMQEEPNMDRARDCAEHFGKCSIKEMEKLKTGKILVYLSVPVQCTGSVI